MQSKLTEFYLIKEEPNRSCLQAMREILLREDLSEGLKYGMPCFSFRGKAFCYLWTDKKTKFPYLLMVKGNEIEHPALEQGDRKRMKILMLDPEVDIPLETILEVFKKAKSLYPAQ